MIVSKTSVDTMCMYVVMLGFTIAPLLETCFTMVETVSPHIQQAPPLRLPEAGCALMHHLRHLPPIMRLGVAMSCTAGASGIGTSGDIRSVLPLCVIVSADHRSQLSVNDDVRVKIVPCAWCLIVPSRLPLARSTLWLVQ